MDERGPWRSDRELMARRLIGLIQRSFTRDVSLNFYIAQDVTLDDFKLVHFHELQHGEEGDDDL